MIIIKTQDIEYKLNVDHDKFKGFILPTLLNGFNCFPYTDANRVNDEKMFNYEEAEVKGGTRVRLSLIEQPYEISYVTEYQETETSSVDSVVNTPATTVEEETQETETDDKKTKKNK